MRTRSFLSPQQLRVFCSAIAVAVSAACDAMPSAPTSPTPIEAVAASSGADSPPNISVQPNALGVTRFVAFGDSITYGTLSSFDTFFFFNDAPDSSPPQSYPTRLRSMLRQAYPNQAAVIDVINAGFPGERALEGRTRIESVLATHRPQAVLLLAGVNDMTFGGTHSAAAAAVMGIVQAALRQNVPVLLALMPQTYAAVYPNGETRPQAAEQIVPFNDELRRLAAGLQNVHIVDLYSSFGLNRSLIGNDGLHPTETGYGVMTNAFFNAVRAAFPVRGSFQ